MSAGEAADVVQVVAVQRRPARGRHAEAGPAGDCRAGDYRAGDYRADIDGLRALAVLAVVLYHADIAGFGGGYVGVDVFFVISGYLISRNVADEIAAGRFSFSGFYERRARRILPALLAVLPAAGLLALVMLSPAELIRFAASAVAAVLGLSNVLFRCAMAGGGYFDDGAEPVILLHTWSLGVEEQFYLLLPPALLLLRRLCPGREWLGTALLMLLSFAWSAHALDASPKGAFFFVFPRAWELLAGSLLALRPRGASPCARAPWIDGSVAFAGLAAVLFAVLAYTKATRFPGPAALPPVLGACLLLWSGEGGRPTLVARLLALPPVAGLGLVSYSLYLWHWPILVAARMLHPLGLPLPVAVAALVASLCCAILSTRFVEQPFRRRRLLASRRSVFAGSAAALAGVVLLAGLTAVVGGMPGRFDQRTVAALDGNEARAGEAIAPACLNWRKPLASAADVALCPVGDDHAARRIAFLGDSHVAQLRPLVARLAAEGALDGREAIFPVSAGCVPSTTMNLAQGVAHCPTAMRLATAIAGDDRVDTVLIGFSAWWENDPGTVCLSDGEEHCRRLLGAEEIATRLAGELAAEVRDLRRRDKAVIVMLPLPSYNHAVPEVEKRVAILRARHLDAAADALAKDLRRYDFLATRRILREAVEAAGAVVYDPRDALCGAAGCAFAADGVSLYSDGTHIARSQADVFHDGLAAVFRDLYAPLGAATRSARAENLP